MIKQATIHTNAPMPHSEPTWRHGASRVSPLLLLMAMIIVLPRAAWAQEGQVDGIVVAAYDARLALPVSGVVDEVAVAPGDRVEAGAVLARLDDTQADLQVHLARIALPDNDVGRSAQDQLRAARDAEDQDAIRGAEAQLALLTRARLEFQLAEARLAQHTLKAPVDGVVERVVALPGQFLAAGQPLVRLVQIDQPLVETNIPSDRAASLKVGDAVAIHPRPGGGRAIDGAAASPIAGRIAYLSPIIDPRTDARFARIAIETPQAAESRGRPILRIGAHVSIALTIDAEAPAPPSTDDVP